MGRRVRAARRMIVLVLMNVVVLALLLEIGGNVFYLIIHKQFFYTRARSPLGDSRPETNPFMSGAFHPAIHPYYGFIYKPHVDVEKTLPYLKINNHGFMFSADYVRRNPGCCDFPSERSGQDDVIVGIFGGSVAAALVLRMQDNPAVTEAFRAIPRFAGKRIRFLSFALGGSKQSQQLMILAYYLSLGQPLDVVVNVDGFNEVVSGPGLLLRGVEVAYPDGSIWFGVSSFIERQTRYAHNPEDVLVSYHSMMRDRWARRAAGCRTMSCYSLAKLVNAWHEGNARDPASSARPAATPPYFFQMDPSRVVAKDMFEFVGQHYIGTRAAYDIVAAHWARSSQVMQGIARSHDMLYVHVLQPNPWLRRSTPFVPRGPKEYSAHLEHLVPRGYGGLLAESRRLRAAGVNFVDATALLDHEPLSVYSDDIGHLDPRGYDLLALAIVKAIAAPSVR